VLLAVAAVWLAPALLFLLVAEALLLLACREYIRLARASGLRVPAVAAAAAAALTCAAFSRVLVTAPLDVVLMSALVVLAEGRARLGSRGDLSEPLSRAADRRDDCRP
jgi:hypothetical protein